MLKLEISELLFKAQKLEVLVSLTNSLHTHTSHTHTHTHTHTHNTQHTREDMDLCVYVCPRAFVCVRVRVCVCVYTSIIRTTAV